MEVAPPPKKMISIVLFSYNIVQPKVGCKIIPEWTKKVNVLQYELYLTAAQLYAYMLYARSVLTESKVSSSKTIWRFLQQLGGKSSLYMN